MSVAPPQEHFEEEENKSYGTVAREKQSENMWEECLADTYICGNLHMGKRYGTWLLTGKY